MNDIVRNYLAAPNRAKQVATRYIFHSFLFAAIGFFCHQMQAQQQVQVYPDSANLKIDSVKSSPHYLPYLHFYLPIGIIEKRNFLLNVAADVFYDSIGSIHLQHDFYGVNISKMNSNFIRKRTEIGINIILGRKEKYKPEKFYVNKYNHQIKSMQYYMVDARMQKAWMARLGALRLQNPMVEVDYKFKDGGNFGIPMSTKYIDSIAKPVPLFYIGLGRFRKRIMNGTLGIPNSIQPHVSKYTFYYFDMMYTQTNKKGTFTQLPYTDLIQDKPIFASVEPISKIPNLGFRIGLYGMAAKRNYLPYFYQAELGTYPGYAWRNGFYFRISAGLRLCKVGLK